MTGDPPRLADRLASGRRIVGRTRDQERLADLLTTEDGPAVVFVHGAGGIGKSVLVAATIDRLGATALTVDGRGVEPTPVAVLRELAAQLGLPPTADVDAVAAAAGSASVELVVLDSYEHLGIADGWVRNDLLPALPATTRAVLVGRNAPNVAWRTAPGWRHLVAEHVVGPMTEDDARALLAGRGLSPAAAERALQFGRGHPLALELAVEAFGRAPDLQLHDGPPPDVVEELVDVLFDGLEPDTRRTAEAVSVLRRVTEPLLTAVLGVVRREEPDGAAIDAAWRTLRALPFTEVTPVGLVMQPVVRDVVATSLELRNPGLAREIRRRAAHAAAAEIGTTPSWAPTADLLHLVQNSVIRDAFVPPSGAQHPVERARASDRDEVLEIATCQQGTDEAALLARWWDRHEPGFVVARDPHGAVGAFSVVVEAHTVHPSLGDDPIYRAMLDDLAARPLPDGMTALVNRCALAASRGGRPSPALAPVLVDIKRTYLELRPHLARVYVVRTSSEIEPMMRALGFRELGHVEVGGVTMIPSVLDFGPGSVDGWLASLVEHESAPVTPVTPVTTGGSTDGSGADGAIDPVRVPAPGVDALSPREREVLAALADGLSNQELAERLFISERTANRHLSNIFTKLGVHNRTAAAAIAVRSGLAG